MSVVRVQNMEVIDFMFWRAILFVMSVALLVAGCGTSTYYTPINAPPHAMRARPTSSVQVFHAMLPERPFVEVGLIQVRESSAFSSENMPELIEEMRVQAGKRGCDGLIVGQANNKTVGSGGYHYSPGYIRTLEGFDGTCIVYRHASF